MTLGVLECGLQKDQQWADLVLGPKMPNSWLSPAPSGLVVVPADEPRSAASPSLMLSAVTT